MKTQAAILVELHRSLVIDEVEVPPVTFGQARVRIEASGICGSQVGEIDGKKGHDPWLPHLLGHEGTGFVEEVGPGVSTVAPGDRVVLHWRPGSGLEAPTARYRWGRREVNAGRVTTFQRHAVVSENRMTRIPKELDAVSSVLYGCAFTTGYGVVCNDARVRIGESLVVLGAGGVGLCVGLAAHLAGAHPIVAVDVRKEKLDLAYRFGATHGFEATAPDLDERILAVVGDSGADVVVETTGLSDVMERASRLTAPRGRTILVGVPMHGERLSVDTLPLHFGKVLTGSHGGEAQPAEDIPRLVRLERAGRFDLRPLVSHRLPLDRVNEGIELMRSGEALRCVLIM